MYLRRVPVAGRSFAAALTHVSAALTPPAPAAENHGAGLRRPCRGRRIAEEKHLGRCAAEPSKYYRYYRYSGKLTLEAMYLWRVRVLGRSFAAVLTHISTVATPPAPAT
jgi:hypothetical protein